MRPILITGATGTLGRAFHRICAERGLATHLTSRAELDIASERSVAAALERHEPWLVINAAGYVRVDDAERDAERCRRENVLGPERLARACQRAKIGLVSFSSDLVFDGRKGEPYEEHDRPAPPVRLRPHQARGRAARPRRAPRGARRAHQRVLRAVGRAQLHHPEPARAGRRRATVRAAADTTVSPTYVPDLVHACLDLRDRRRGRRLAPRQRQAPPTWDAARAAARAARLRRRPRDRRCRPRSCRGARRGRSSARSARRAACSSRGWTTRSAATTAPAPRSTRMSNRERILVTGGAGFVGSHFARLAADAGRERGRPRRPLRRAPPRPCPPSIPLVVGDIGDRALVGRLVREHGVGAVAHFAGKIQVGESVRDPGPRTSTSTSCARSSLLDAMRDGERHRVPVLVDGGRVPAPRRGARSPRPRAREPVNPYGATKLAIELRARRAGRGAYGAALGRAALLQRRRRRTPTARCARATEPETHLIPLVLDAGLGARRRRSASTATTTHARRHLRPRLHPRPGPRERAPRGARAASRRGQSLGAMNLGTGRGYSVREVIDAAARGARPPRAARHRAAPRRRSAAPGRRPVGAPMQRARLAPRSGPICRRSSRTRLHRAALEGPPRHLTRRDRRITHPTGARRRDGIRASR